MTKIKTTKSITVCRPWEDGGSTDYKVTVSDGDVHIDQGSENYIYFPKFLTDALIMAISEVSGSIEISPDVHKSDEVKP